MRFQKKRLWSYGPVLVFSSALALTGVSTGTARAGQDADVTRTEVANFDAFLDAHPDIDRDLRANPSLITNGQYLQNHEQLRAYLNAHPRISSELKEDSNFFMRREQRFDARERNQDRDRDARDRDDGAGNPNPDLRTRDVARMDQFLDQHPNIDRDLRANPSLINNAEYLSNHPDLSTYLNQNPAMKDEFKENPSYFMQRERRFDARTDRADQDRDQMDRDRDRDRTDRDRDAANPNPDLRTRDIARMDQFLDQNPNIDRDLRANPSLINNADYLRDHPSLARYLNQNPAMKEEFKENPNYFMHREQRFDARTDRTDQNRDQMDRDRDRDRTDRDRDAANPNPDLRTRDVARMDQFLDQNPNIDRDLRANPSLINNADYLRDHPDLARYLNQNPAMKEEFKENPSYFMQREQRLDARTEDRDRTDRDRDRTDRDVNRDRDRDAADRDRDRDRTDQDANRGRNPNPDLTNGEVASMDQFLDDHKQIAKDLEKNPNLLTDTKYIDKHKELRNFLDEHPAVREEARENPDYFMRRENRFETSARDREADRNRVADRDDGNRDRDARGDRDRDRRDADVDVSRQDLRDMDNFLDKHKKIANDLEKNPSLATNSRYLSRHKDLRSFLSSNPKVNEELRENPARFMQDETRFDQKTRMNHPPTAVKAKTKVEQHEETHPPQRP